MFRICYTTYKPFTMNLVFDADPGRLEGPRYEGLINWLNTGLLPEEPDIPRASGVRMG